ncbi:MAG: VOC family protein [Gammaproteobacteria bacterium]|nr:VOC family protein [Gammaproteobacteria bacterium]
MPQKIIPHIWFQQNAAEAAEFYASVFPDAKVDFIQKIDDTPKSEVEMVGFQIMGYSMMAIGAGPHFTINPSISMMVNFDPSQLKGAREKIDEVWDKLADGGEALMPIDTYPFSERYGWIRDKYGFSWQLIFTNPEGEDRPLMVPSMLFVGDKCGQAKEASDFYLSVFKDTKRGAIATYADDMPPNKAGDTMFTDFMLECQWFAAMDSSLEHNFSFNEAVSLMISCDDQRQIDYYWEKLSAVPEAEQCGWVKDKYGISWQIIPANMGELMGRNPEKTTPAMLKMKKIIIADLEKAANS